MKVVMLSCSVIRGLGADVFISNLAHHVSDIGGIELHLLRLGNKNQWLKQGSIWVHMVNSFHLPSLIIMLLEPLLFRREILNINPDIVHQIGNPYSTTAAYFRNRFPSILSVIGLNPTLAAKAGARYASSLHYAGALMFKPIERYVLSRTPNIIVEAASIKDLIQDMINARIWVVTNGVEFEKIQGFQPPKSEKPDIFFITRLTKMKGADILIKALPRVVKAVRDLSVYIAGSGPQEDELKSLVGELNLEAHVKFLGFISDEEEKYQYYKACKVVVAPSRWDCQPLALVEAAASGKPVIASDMSNPGIVSDGETGLLFQSENVDDLASKIIKLLGNDKLREEMGDTALERAKESDWNKLAEKTVEIYKTVIADFHERRA